MASLSLTPVVDVVVQVSPLSAPRRAFDLGLIIGDKTVIPVADRVRLYENTNAMLEDGFTNEDPEYEAAQIYFSQVPRSSKLLVGRQILTAISAVTVNAGGTGYAEGDILTVTQSGGAGGTLRVSEVTEGAVTGVTVLTQGSGYAVGTGLATTVSPTGGTGCTINITSVGETALQSVQACRAANTDWYGVSFLNATDEEIEAIAEYIETATPTSTQFYTTQDTAAITSATDDIFSTLKGLNLGRSLGQFSTKSAYAAVGIMGYAMRANTGLANSAYTLKFKRIIGVEVEPLTATQVTILEGKNGNAYINRGFYYDMFEQGVMANGQFFDEVVNLDMLANNIQLNVMDKLYQFPKVPQTEPGVTQLINACAQACDRSVIIGFLAPGVWTGQPVLNLNTGDILPQGYLIQAEAINSQSQADREARKAPPIYVCIKEAGAIHSVTIGVYVNR